MGADPIGTSWHDAIPKGHPGSASDMVMTSVSKCLEQVPPGMAVEVGAASCHIYSFNSKVGKTLIPIEQSNGQMKQSTRFFNSPISILQFGLADLLFRVGYLIQNFKLGFIQERCPKEGEDSNGRPCHAEIRWHGATDIGLIDVQPNVDLWGSDEEVRW
eukprot:scaffold15609_cov55-Attheya_sp.AAC.7